MHLLYHCEGLHLALVDLSTADKDPTLQEVQTDSPKKANYGRKGQCFESNIICQHSYEKGNDEKMKSYYS